MLLALFGSSFVTAQWTVSSCEDLGLNPIEPGSGLRLLEIYLEGTPEGIGGLGCWVHHHPNGKDYIITPHNWGKEPNPGKRSVIRDAMDAITIARAEYVAYGSLNAHLYYILDDNNRTSADSSGGYSRLHGNAFWLIGNECWMRSGVPTNRHLERNHQKQVYAHEVGHCFVMENVPKLREQYTMNSWFDESVAEMLGSEAYPRANFEHIRSQAFDLDGKPYRQEYNAYVFWYALKKSRGPMEVVTLMNKLAPLKTREARLQVMREGRYDRDFHQFLFNFFQKDLMDSGGGGPIPRETQVNIIDDNPVPLIVGDDPIPIGPVEPERLSVLELTIPADHDLKIYPPYGVSEPLFISVITKEKKVRDLKATETFKGYCGQNKNVKVLISHLNDNALSFEIKYNLKEKSCCESGTLITENPTEDNLNGTFQFDYYIESDIAYRRDGDIQNSTLNYYVNSKDNSMLLTDGWILDQFGQDQNSEFKVNAVIWLPNRQLVGYVDDKVFKRKRAITIDIDQMRGDVLAGQKMSISEFLEEAVASSNTMTPANLPSGSPWHNHATGYAYKGENPEQGNETFKYSGYISNESTSISSPLPAFGFLVGHIRDLQGKNKNLVYTKVENQNGDMLEGHLKSIQKECFFFDGTGYEKLSLGGFTGTAPNNGSGDEEARGRIHDEFDRQMKVLKEELQNCKDQACATRIAKKMMDIQQQKRQALYDLPKDPAKSGTAGTDKQSKMKVIQDKIHLMTQRMLDQNKKCGDLRKENYNCQRCKEKEVERCEAEAERLGKEMQLLACELAKQQGFGDVMEGCD